MTTVFKPVFSPVFHPVHTLSPVQRIYSRALVDLSAEGIVGSAPVTAWTNSGLGGSSYNLDVQIGGTPGALTKTTVNGKSVVAGAGDAGLEVSDGGVTITTPMTIFCVGKVNADTGANQIILHAESDTSNAVLLYIAPGPVFVTNAGSGLSTATADTNAHVFTVQHNGDTTSKFTVSGISSHTGDMGSENWDFATIFANTTGASSLAGDIRRVIVFDYALSEADVAAVQFDLQNEYL